MRGLDSEFAKSKVYLPRSKKPLPFESDGTWDRKAWQQAEGKFGAAARVGDRVKITKIVFGPDRIVLEINNGLKGGHWYDRVQVGMGPDMTPVNTNQSTSAPGGTSIALLFHKPLPPMDTAGLKKILAPLFDFDKHTATATYESTLPPEVRKAIADKKPLEGMDRDQVLLALGKPKHKDRQTIDGDELEDWIYGDPPGKITFVTFSGSKVVKIREEYASVGGSTVPSLPPHE